MEKSKKVTLLATIILLGFVFGVFYHYILGFYLHKGEFYNSFLYPASYSFCDFFGMQPYLKDGMPYNDVTLWVNYFPFTYVFIIPFMFIKNEIVRYLSYLAVFIVYIIFMNIRHFYCENLSKLQNLQNIFILTALSYPILYCIDKGNFDMYMLIFLSFWAYLFSKQKYKSSALILALINSMKPFTILFLFLYLFKRRFKECFLSILVSAIIVILSFLILPHPFTEFINFLKTIPLFKINYALYNGVWVGYESSVFNNIKLLFLHFNNNVTVLSMVKFLKFYDYFCIGISIITLYFVWKEKLFWKQLMLLICNFILLPYVTYDYKFIFLFIPTWMFINSVPKKLDIAYIMLIGLLLIPKNILISIQTFTHTSGSWLPFSEIVNPIIMIIICGLIIYEQFSETENKFDKIE